MKNLFLTAAALCVLLLSSCSKSAEKATEATNDFKSKIENCTNPDSIAKYVDQAKAYAQKLVDEGKIDQAKEVLEKLQPVVEEKAPALAGTFSSVKGLLDKIPGATESAVDNAKESATALGDSVASDVKNTTDAAKQSAADAIDNAKQAVSDKTNEVVDATKKAVSDKASEATDAVKDKLNDLK